MTTNQTKTLGNISRRGRTRRLAAATLFSALLVSTSAGVATAAEEAEAMPAGDFAVLVRGELFTDDMTAAQAAHDAVAAGGEEAAKAAGDIYHLAGVSTSLLGNSEGSFLGVDRWSSPENIEAFYSDPAVAEGFGALFAAAPTVELFVRQPEWYQWGEMPDPTSSDGVWIAVVRGQLADADPMTAQQAHDAVASAGQEPSMAAGDISHIVYTGLQDPTQFLAFDVWENNENIEAVYGDPAFQAGFQALFADTPTVVIYESTDWHQW